MVKAVKAAQLADLIRDYVAQWSSQDLKGYFFSLTDVTITPDLTSAIIWVDILQKDQERKILSLLESKRSTYQRRLNREIKRHSIPLIHFQYDTRQDLSEHFAKLLKG